MPPYHQPSIPKITPKNRKKERNHIYHPPHNTTDPLSKRKMPLFLPFPISFHPTHKNQTPTSAPSAKDITPATPFPCEALAAPRKGVVAFVPLALPLALPALTG